MYTQTTSNNDFKTFLTSLRNEFLAQIQHLCKIERIFQKSKFFTLEQNQILITQHITNNTEEGDVC